MISACQVPSDSALEPWRIADAFLLDSFSAPLRRRELGMAELFAAIFGHHTGPMKAALLARNAVVRLCGVETPDAADILRPEFKARYEAGEKIGPWPVYMFGERELIAGRDEKHLDFRVSLHKGREAVTITTVCTVNNAFGRPYLRVVKPFHQYGVRALLRNAVTAGRI